MKNQKRNRNKNTFGVGIIKKNSNADAILTEQSMILEYAFEQGVNFSDRVISITDEINAAMFQRIDAAMTELERKSKAKITVRINSPGGEVYHALAIVGRLRRSKCQIVTEGYGHVMSAATLILASGQKRFISKYAFFMHHEASYTVEGRHSQIKAEMEQAEREEDKWSEWMAKFSQRDTEYWKSLGVGTDAYLTPEELKEHGVIDEII